MCFIHSAARRLSGEWPGSITLVSVGRHGGPRGRALLLPEVPWDAHSLFKSPSGHYDRAVALAMRVECAH